MFSKDPRMNPHTADVVYPETNQPYARRTIHTVFVFVLVLFLMGAFVGWYFFNPSEEEVETRDVYIQAQTEPQVPGNRYEEGTGRSGVYNFFYRMFGGIEDGLDDNPHNLSNVEHLDDYNLDNNDFDSNASAALAVERYAEQRAAQFEALNQDEYRHSVFDVVGSEVYGRKGDRAGTIHDILVNKDTGKAKVIIINDDNSHYERDLTAVKFKKVLKQQEDGDVMMTITEEKIEDKPDFRYSPVEDKNYVSLRHLRDGQLLDFEDKVAGQIDAVIYENAEAQNIYFTLRPVLAQHGISKFFLPFEDINIIESADGYDIKLTKEQTVALAETLFEGE